METITVNLEMLTIDTLANLEGAIAVNLAVERDNLERPLVSNHQNHLPITLSMIQP